MKKLNLKCCLVGLIFSFIAGQQVLAQSDSSIQSTSYYQANWESLKDYKTPEWYKDAKLGFWVHWGVYSVPAFKGDHAAEWYGRAMYCYKGQSYNEQEYKSHLHHEATYGNPSVFGYKDFIPMFKAENFNPEEWTKLCVTGGAKFFTMMATHHDSFCMWKTKLSKWNSVDMGPHRDCVGEMEKAVRKAGLHFGVSNHSAWNYCFFEWNHINRYDAMNPEYQDLYGNPIVQACADTIQVAPGESKTHWKNRSRGAVSPSKRDVSRWLARTKELDSLYSPDLYYFDWGFKPIEFEQGRKEFGAYFYNHAISNGQGVKGNPNVVLNYKGGAYPKGSAIRDYERGSSAKIADITWQTDDCVYDGNNWGYAEGVPIKPTNTIVDELVDVVSKRGVLMLSFAPKADGTFPEDQKTLIYQLGSWLKICGNAIYCTRPYKIMGELSKDWGKADAKNYRTYHGTSDDIRYTRSKDGKTLYAIILDWPGESICIQTLSDLNTKNIRHIRLLGVNKNLKWKMTKQGLEITMPERPEYKYAYPLEIKFKNSIKY